MNPADFDGPISMLGLEDVENPGKGKTVVEVRLYLRETPGSSPPKHVYEIETGDGAKYRFQRFGAAEPLVKYDREKADGEKFARIYGLPRHVAKVRDAIEAGKIRPSRGGLESAVTPSLVEKGTETPRAVADGGEDEIPPRHAQCAGESCDVTLPVHLLEGGLCPPCANRQYVEKRLAERSQRTTWIDDPDDPQGYGDA